MPDQTLAKEYFDEMYRNSDDPWHFVTSAYEREKYDATLAALPQPKFSNVLEIGCSIGVLSRELSKHAGRQTSIDINKRALELARGRCADLAHVEFVQAAFPRDVPSGKFDFVLVSEVGYYWSDIDLAKARDVLAAIAPGAFIELVHYLPKVAEYPRDGDSVHEAFLGDARFKHIHGRRAELYRLDVFRLS